MLELSLRNKALDLLSRREHSTTEIREKLCRYESNSDIVKEVIKSLKAENLLNDQRYTEAVVKEKSVKGYGPIYIENFLKKKGLTQYNSSIHELEIDWLEVCRSVFQKKCRNKDLSSKEKEKILRFLAYRGFSYEIIKSAISF